MNNPARASLLALASTFALALAACGGGSHDDPDVDAAPPPPPVDAAPAPDAPPPPTPDAGVAPALRNHVDGDDFEIADKALTLMGANLFGKEEPHSCNDCHSINRGLMRHWDKLGTASATTCLTDPAVATPESARRMIDCLRANPNDPSSPFMTPKLGWYSIAANLPWFEYTFSKAYGAEAAAKLKAFKERVAMPKGNHEAFTQNQFDIVAEWFVRGMPNLEFIPGDPPPAECTTNIGPEVAPHVATMKQSGWGAVNRANGILMFGCAGQVDPLKCLSTLPHAADKSYGVGWESFPGASLRILRENHYSSAYWTRSSADGRFVAHGGDSTGSGKMGATTIDLQAGKVIPTNAMFDPGFFPDNSGFVFQGAGASFCPTSVLTAGPTTLTLSEPGCTTTDVIGLYQHVGAALGGGDYWIVDSNFSSDDGGKAPQLGDMPTFFGKESTVRLTPMVHTGSAYVPGEAISRATPYEGDTVISPSSTLLVSRLAGPGDTMRGYTLRQVNGTGTNVSVPEIARYCMHGGKPAFSFDERWMVLHHYVEEADAVELGFTGPNDPAFAAFKEKGAANLYLVDLVTGARTRITRMNPGQYALFPHFRSDGWIYFVVRTVESQDEIMVASDAALILP